VEEEQAPMANGYTPADNTEHPSTEKPEEITVLASEETKSNANNEGPETMSDGAPSTSVTTGPQLDLTSPLSTPVTERRNSQDSFTSAASEITPAEATASPDPEHGITREAVTPTTTVPGTLPPPTPTQAHVDPSNATSPAVPALHSDISKEASSPTKASVPPPLPRRAAARARPTSIVPPTFSATPTAQTTTESISEAKISYSDTLHVPNAEVTTKEPTTDALIASPELPKEVEISLESADSAVKSVIEEKIEVTEESTTSHATNGMEEADAERLSNPSPTDEKLSDIPSSPTGTLMANYVNGTDANAAPKVPSQTGEDVDGEVYVGDATWEERTWKELIKLKEDMFWARIGGLR
jgi:hypothetical protein